MTQLLLMLSLFLANPDQQGAYGLALLRGQWCRVLKSNESEIIVKAAGVKKPSSSRRWATTVPIHSAVSGCNSNTPVMFLFTKNAKIEQVDPHFSFHYEGGREAREPVGEHSVGSLCRTDCMCLNLICFSGKAKKMSCLASAVEENNASGLPGAHFWAAVNIKNIF